MALSLQNFSGLVQSMAASAQAACAQLVDFTVGSISRAITEGCASIALWLQWLILAVLNSQRLATCFGSQVDTFIADFGMARLPGVASTGYVSLQRFYPTTSNTVLVGSTVLTGDGSQTFAIVADSTNAYWNASLTNPAGSVVGGFVIPSGVASANVLVQNTVAGTAGNVASGTITMVGTAGIADTVTNASAFTNGVNAESDAAVKARFALYIGGLSKATQTAIESAIAGVQQGLTYNIGANINPSGVTTPGFFTVTIDDGSGNPPTSLLNAVYAAISPVRALCETFTVQGPSDLDVTIDLTLTVAAGIVKANIIGTVELAIQEYVNSLPVGATLPYSMIANLAYNSLPQGQITNVTGITVNGGTADIVPTATQVVKASTVTVS